MVACTGQGPQLVPRLAAFSALVMRSTLSCSWWPRAKKKKKPSLLLQPLVFVSILLKIYRVYICFVMTRIILIEQTVKLTSRLSRKVNTTTSLLRWPKQAFTTKTCEWKSKQGALSAFFFFLQWYLLPPGQIHPFNVNKRKQHHVA